MKRRDNLGICVILMIGYHMVHSIDIFSDQYVGCYEERSNGGLDHTQEPWPTSDNSINSCVDYCKSKGYAYAGMKRGEICRCGNTYFGRFSWNCWNSNRVKCPGNQSAVCGGTGGNKGDRYEGTSTFRVCPAGRYGSSCSDMCPVSCGGKGCHFDRNCLNECPAGRYGTDCLQTCLEGKFGANCKEQCRDCLKNRCNPVNGYCTEGCKTVVRRYGPFCRTSHNASNDNPTGPCPFCGHCKNSICADGIGISYNACPDFWQGDKCQECDDGSWGTRCENCPNCASGKCSVTYGLCVGEGCNDGFYGSKCSDICQVNCLNNTCVQNGGDCSYGCNDGFHGLQCNDSCPANCASSKCSQDGNSCTLGCNDGFHGAKCTKDCSQNCKDRKCDKNNHTCSDGCVDGYYEDFCNKTCPGHCVSGACSRDDGSCPGECVNGYYGDKCNVTCPENCKPDKCLKNGSCSEGCYDGFYESLCLEQCPTNCASKRCFQTNGTCSDGCLNGTCGMDCRKTCKESNPGEACTQTTCLPLFVKPPTKDTAVLVASVVVGSILLLGVIAGITFLAVLYYKRRGPTNKNAEFSNVITNQHIDPPLPLVTTINNPAKERKPAKPVKPVKPTTADKPILQTQSQEDVTGKPSMKVKPYVDAPLTSSPLVKPSSSNSPHAACSGSIDVTEDDENTYYNVMHLSANISKDQLKECIKTSEANGELNKQYLRLKPGKVYPWTVAELEENAPKNRYKGISAYDHSRVVLQRENPEEGDYINANYMPGYSGEKEFIASQGVTAQNLVDFWRMIWQEKVSTIVMTTKLKEVKMKSLQYWPDDSDPLDYGAINVTLLETSIRFQFVIRKLLAKKGASKRILHHLHFVGWPDHGVPDSPISLVNFWHEVHTLPTRQAPVLVHCSAGVGRTGTFIALDYLLEEARATHNVDVLRCVDKLRYNRVDMVQNVNQYIFLHHAVYEGIFIGPTLLSREQLTESDQTDSDAITKQIEALNEMHPYDAKASASYEKGDEDSEWSLYVFKVLGRGQNAIEIRNPKGSTIIISTPPEPDVTADFWVMVQRYRTGSIVINKPDVKKSPWLPTHEHNIALPHSLCVKQQHTGEDSTRIIIGTPASIDYYNVTQKTNEEEKGEGDESTYMNITEKTVDVSAGASAGASAGDGDGAKQDVEESTYMNTEEAKQEGPCVIQLLTLDDMTPANIVNTWQKMQRGKPHISISKHCSGGVFAVSCVLLDMMEVFGQVDVLSTVRQLRPHFIRNEVEYKMLHRVLHLYCQQQSTQ